MSMPKSWGHCGPYRGVGYSYPHTSCSAIPRGVRVMMRDRRKRKAERAKAAAKRRKKQ